MKKIGLFPGSFDPFTKGHELIVKKSIKIFDEIILNNNCQCSNERVLNTLKSMDQKEIIYLFNKKKTIEVVCEFCKTKRVFSEQDLK